MANKQKLVTHDGSFHADDVFACASLLLLLEKKGKKFEIIRTRDEEMLKKGDYVFDIGRVYDANKNRFDHHQSNFKEKRKNSIPFSSFGLESENLGSVVLDNASDVVGACCLTLIINQSVDGVRPIIADSH